MDFIERWLHVSPDHGSGSLETILLAALGLAVFLMVRAAKLARRRER
jgi:hypothetical protein